MLLIFNKNGEISEIETILYANIVKYKNNYSVVTLYNQDRTTFPYRLYMPTNMAEGLITQLAETGKFRIERECFENFITEYMNRNRDYY